MEPLGKLLQRVTTDSLRTSQSVDAVGTSERMRYQHAEALLQLLRNAVLARDWPRAAGASPPRAPRTPARLTPTGSAGLRGSASNVYLHAASRESHAAQVRRLLPAHAAGAWLARGWAHPRSSSPPTQATEVCRQCDVPFHGDLEAAAHRQTRKRAKMRRNALVAEAEGMQWAAALAVHKGDLDSARLVAAHAKNHAAAALIAYAKWCAPRCGCIPAVAADAPHAQGGGECCSHTRKRIFHAASGPPAAHRGAAAAQGGGSSQPGG